MASTDCDVGKRWMLSTVDELQQTAGIGVEAAWGPAWTDAPARIRRGMPKPPTTALLILTSGSRQRILWIPEEELLQAGIDRSLVRERIRKRVAAKIEAFRSPPAN